jgi:hypothetical protein
LHKYYNLIASRAQQQQQQQQQQQTAYIISSNAVSSSGSSSSDAMPTTGYWFLRSPLTVHGVKAKVGWVRRVL